MRPQLQKDDLLRADDHTLTWRLPPRADYALTAPETVGHAARRRPLRPGDRRALAARPPPDDGHARGRACAEAVGTLCAPAAATTTGRRRSCSSSACAATCGLTSSTLRRAAGWAAPSWCTAAAALLHGLRSSAGATTGGWEAEVRPPSQSSPSMSTRWPSGAVGGVAGYDIQATETLTLTRRRAHSAPPRAACRRAASLKPVAAAVALNGSLVRRIPRAWCARNCRARRRARARGRTSRRRMGRRRDRRRCSTRSRAASAPSTTCRAPSGWDAVVRAALTTPAPRAALADTAGAPYPRRRGATSRTLRRSPRGPADALRSGAALAATARVVVRPIAGRVSLSGALLDNAREAKVRDDSDYVLTLTLTDDAWAPALRRRYASVVEASADGAAREGCSSASSLNSSSSYPSIDRVGRRPRRAAPRSRDRRHEHVGRAAAIPRVRDRPEPGRRRRRPRRRARVARRSTARRRSSSPPPPARPPLRPLPRPSDRERRRRGQGRCGPAVR